MNVNGFFIEAKQDENGWVTGIINAMGFSAKVYDEGSRFGIDEGRVSKLAVWLDDIATGKRVWIVNYDRGWDVRPKKAADKKMLAALLLYLGGLPTASFWETVAEKAEPFITKINVRGYPTRVKITIDHTGWAQVQDCLTGLWYKRLDPLTVYAMLQRRI